MSTKDSEETRNSLSEVTGTHWVAVKFHKEKPRGIKLSAPEPFCAAAVRAITESVVLKVSAIPCGGARYAFGASGSRPPAMGVFAPERLGGLLDRAAAVSLSPRLPFSPGYVSLNLPGHAADVYLSFMLPESANELAQIWPAVAGKKLSCRLDGVMSFCSEGTAAALTGRRPALSLGCAKAAKNADLRGQVCVCLPESAALKLAAAWTRGLAAAGGGKY